MLSADYCNVVDVVYVIGHNTTKVAFYDNLFWLSKIVYNQFVTKIKSKLPEEIALIFTVALLQSRSSGQQMQRIHSFQIASLRANFSQQLWH